MSSISRRIVFAIALAIFPLLPTNLTAADLDQNLVARWTFQDGSLKSDVGKFEFDASERGALDIGPGTVVLLDRKYLYCPGISSRALPELEQGVTIWARVKFDTLPTEGELGVMGLLSSLEAGSWYSQIFSLFYRPMVEDPEHAGLAFLSRPRNTQELGVGVSRFQPVAAGQFIEVALVFDGAKKSAGMWVSSSGQLVESRLSGANALQEFEAFMIGKIMMPGAESSITFDEVRIYSTALDAQWLEEIKAIENK